jgi:hypothetical protein
MNTNVTNFIIDPDDEDEPLPPIPDIDYETAGSPFGDELDGICIRATMENAIRRGLCDLDGIAYYDGDEEAPYEAEAARCFEALALAGFIHRESYGYRDGRAQFIGGANK